MSSENVTFPTDWQDKQNGVGTKYKEILGGRAFFTRCCGLGMRRILGFERDPLHGIRRIGDGIIAATGHFCEVCETRRNEVGMQ